MLENGEYIEVENIIQCKDNMIFVIGKKLLNVQDLYDVPMKSSLLQINIVNKNYENQTSSAWNINCCSKSLENSIWRTVCRIPLNTYV